MTPKLRSMTAVVMAVGMAAALTSCSPGPARPAPAPSEPAAASIMAEGVLDYVLRVGWATGASREPTQLSLSVWQNGTRLDLQAEANELAGVEYPAIPSLYSVHLDEPEYLGSWPGAVPTPPAG